MDSTQSTSNQVVLPKLTGGQFCPYTEPRPGKSNFWTWIGKCFPDSSSQACRHFIHSFQAIMNDACDPRDRDRMCPSDVPSPKNKTTFAPYSGDEVAAWWNEAVDLMPEELLQTLVIPPKPPQPPDANDVDEPVQIAAAPQLPTEVAEVEVVATPTIDFDPPVRRRRKSSEDFI